MISIIAAIGPNRELGKDNKLLWHIPADLKRFKKLTEGHAVIMGRKTFESLGKPLPDRLNVIITRKARYHVFRPPHPRASAGAQAIVSKQISSPSSIFCTSLEEAIKKIPNLSDEVFIIGGGQIYAQALPMADKLYLTLVEKTPEHPDGKFAADTFFPEYEKLFTKKIFEEKHEEDGYKYSFIELTK